MILFVGETFPL